jgi:hypothetical protein
MLHEWRIWWYSKRLEVERRPDARKYLIQQLEGFLK